MHVQQANQAQTVRGRASRWSCTPQQPRCARDAFARQRLQPGRKHAGPLPSHPPQSAAASDTLVADERIDVVVIGAGIGGLSCAALLAQYGIKVVVVESHSAPGGAAHCWSRDTSNGTCHFDSGTALFFGLPAAQPGPGPDHTTSSATHAAASGAAAAGAVLDGSAPAPSALGASGTGSDNPLAAVLTLLGEPLELLEYGPERTCLVLPEGNFNAQIGSDLFAGVVQQLWGSTARQEWLDLQQLCRSLAASAVALHPMVVRHDAAIALTAALRQPLRFIKFMAGKPPLLQDQVMFSQLLESVVSCEPLRAFVDVLCRGASGAPACAISAAYMVRAFAEMFDPGTRLQWPRGGPQAIADALVRGLRKHGGKLLLRTHVTSVLAGPSGRAAGVLVRAPGAGSSGGTSVIRARQAVVSNASLWDTLKLVPPASVLPEFQQMVSASPPSDSFVHLHAVLGGLPPGVSPDQLPVHSYFLAPQLVGDAGWPTLTIASAVDASLAPPGQQVLHTYMAEPWEPWAGLQRGSARYQQLKEQRAQALWQLVEQVLPGAQQHVDWAMVGTPLTHQHFRRRFRGAYGPASSGAGAAQPQAPRAVLAMPGLWCCGDCVFPFIGTPAVAASGMWVANSLAPVAKHWAAVNTVEAAGRRARSSGVALRG